MWIGSPVGSDHLIGNVKGGIREGGVDCESLGIEGLNDFGFCVVIRGRGEDEAASERTLSFHSPTTVTLNSKPNSYPTRKIEYLPQYTSIPPIPSILNHALELTNLCNTKILNNARKTNLTKWNI